MLGKENKVIDFIDKRLILRAGIQIVPIMVSILSFWFGECLIVLWRLMNVRLDIFCSVMYEHNVFKNQLYAQVFLLFKYALLKYVFTVVADVIQLNYNSTAQTLKK